MASGQLLSSDFNCYVHALRCMCCGACCRVQGLVEAYLLDKSPEARLELGGADMRKIHLAFQLLKKAAATKSEAAPSQQQTLSVEPR